MSKPEVCLKDVTGLTLYAILNTGEKATIDYEFKIKEPQYDNAFIELIYGEDEDSLRLCIEFNITSCKTTMEIEDD